MKLKKIFLIFIFGSFVFLLPNFAKGACMLECGYCSGGSDACQWSLITCLNTSVYYRAERLGIIGDVEYNCDCPNDWQDLEFCSDSSGACHGGLTEAFPSGSNGQRCTAWDGCLGLGCSYISISGYWDANNDANGPKCVTCNGGKEDRVLGNTGNIYAGCGSETGISGNGLCESACPGVSSTCDEKGSDTYIGACSYGNPLIRDYCDSSCAITERGGCSASCGTVEAACAGLNPGAPCGSGGTCRDNCTCYIPPPTCSAACTSAGYGSGTCLSGSTSCTAQGYPKVSGNNCYSNCSAKTGTDCAGTCLCFNTDSNKPDCTLPYPEGNICNYDGSTSCTLSSGWAPCSYKQDLNKPLPYFPSGSTCYYNCPVTCTATGWFRPSTCTNSCSTGVCCDCFSDGCNYPNNGKCSVGYGCKPDCTCELGCTGVLTALISGAGTCTVTGGLTASNCSGQAWEIRDGGTTKCSGTVSGTPFSYTCPGWTVGVNSYTYSLYIAGTFKDSRSITCSTTSPPVFDFNISVSPSSDSVSQGSSVPATVNTTLTSSPTQPVSFYASLLSPSGALADYGLSVPFSPASCNPSCGSTMTINTSAGTPVGAYLINICGTGGSNPCFIYGLTVTVAATGIIQPSVTTDTPTNIIETSVTLNGTLTSMGNAASCLVWFEYWPADSPGSKITVYPDPKIRTSIGSFSVDIPNLAPDKKYRFKARAKNGGNL